MKTPTQANQSVRGERPETVNFEFSIHASGLRFNGLPNDWDLYPVNQKACSFRDKFEMLRMSHMIPFDLMNAGDSGKVAGIEGCQAVCLRLRELGIIEGATIEMVQPGEPCIIAIENQRISLRVELPTLIFVELVS